MQLIEIKSYVPQIKRAPHKLYVVEFSLDELALFKIASHQILKTLEPFQDLDDKTNINITGLDGDKGVYDHSNVSSTHGIILDFRPLTLMVIFWEKPTLAKHLEKFDLPTAITKCIRAELQ